MFDAEMIMYQLMKWLKKYFTKASGAKAVIGVSGCRDSAVAAALLKEAIGRDRVMGILMPCGDQCDISVSYELCEFLDIPHWEMNIGDPTQMLFDEIERGGLILNNYALHNTPPRIRMATLYAVSAIVGGRVINTGNLSEKWIGSCTKFGDMAGDVSLFGELTATEVKAIGKVLDLPDKFCEKIRDDGLSCLPGEVNLGFTYGELDRFIRDGVCENDELKYRIGTLNKLTAHKRGVIPTFVPFIPKGEQDERVS